MALLSNGNIVVASPTRNHFLYLYDPNGHLLKRFGRFKEYKSLDNEEVRFLHKGKLLVDAADNIYYVYHYVPMIQKFSPTGDLEREIRVAGDAVDLQQELALRFFSTRTPGIPGGINIINSATVDRKTNHLWIGLNGSSSTGTVYEYSPGGEKLCEYMLEVSSPVALPYIITGVKDVAVTNSKLYIVTNQYQVFHFNRTDSSAQSPTGQAGLVFQNEGYSISRVLWTPPARKPILFAQGCGTEQNWNACSFTCPEPVCNGTTPTATSSTGVVLDCKNSLSITLSTPYIVINSNCTTYPSSTPMHMRGGCTPFVRICKNGQNSDHTLTIDCPTPTCPQGDDDDDDDDDDGGGGFCFPPPGCECCYEWSTCTCLLTPILIDIQGNGFSLTNVSGGVSFDLLPGGAPEITAWTSAGSDDAFLVLDRNGNATIDNGAELFGNFTPQPQSSERNGFIALAEYDKPQNGGNSDGMINHRDAIFSSLRLWQDINHNGISEPGELYTLPALGLASMDLDYRVSRRTDQHGNKFRYRAKVRDTRGAQLGRWAWDVFFAHQ